MSPQSTLDFSALKANRNIAARNYWKSRLAGFECKAYFADDRSHADTPADNRPPDAPAGRKVDSSAGKTAGSTNRKKYAEYTVTAPGEVHHCLNDIAGSDKARHIVLLAALAIFAQKYSSMEDICVFSPTYRNPLSEHGNGQEEEDPVVPVRMKGHPSGSFREFLPALKDLLVTDFKHGNYPVDKMFHLESRRKPGDGLSATGILLEGLQAESAFTKLQPDILFHFSLQAGLCLKIKYNELVYDAGYIELLPDLYFSLLFALIDRRDSPIKDIELISEQEKKKIVQDFNKTAHEYSTIRSLAGLFEQQVKKTPDAVAVEYAGRQTSYKELNRAVNKLARLLLERGVVKGEPVAILLERSTDFIVSVLAVLKAGGLYLPVDTNLPDERIHFMLEDSQTNWLLTRDGYPAIKNIKSSIKPICIDRDKPEIDGFSTRNPPAITGEHIYILYTSGSTGRPKGVIGTQRGLLNRLYWGWENHAFSRNEVCCQKTNPSFVDHVVEIFSPLLKGVPLVIFGNDEVKDVQRMSALIKERGVSRITLVPSLLQALIRVRRSKKSATDTLRYVFCSGEALPYPLAREFYEVFEHAALVNIYGSTEVSADVTCYNVDRTFAGRMPIGSIPIGKPIFNTQILIVDQHNKLTPIGVPGEILISGDGVSPGYVNGKEMSGSKFLINPWFENRTAFRSGDLGRWLPDGNIEFLGRLDHQVKIRGNRVRLDEVANALTLHEVIKEAVVVTGGAGEDKYLAAYYIAGEEIKVAGLRQWLVERLPEYMIPSYFVRLSSFPFTPSGKLDRGALPEPEIKAGADYLAPSNEMEEKLVEIWAGILKLDKKSISVSASFFELGGHSLRAMTLVNKIQGELGMDISIKDVFEYKDILSLATFLQSARISTYTQLKKAEEREYYNLSIAQQRVQYFYELDPYALTFNLPAIVKMEGVLDKNKLQRSFNQLIERQEILRTCFEMIDDQPVQLIAKQFEFEIEYFQADEEEVESLVSSFIRPFDLGQPPLLRVGVTEVSPMQYYLMVDMHHIISDGTSIGLLINDFMALYNDIDLLPLELNYKDYAVWQQSAAYQKKIAKQKEFWVKEFAEPLTPLDIPVDFARPSSTEGDSVRFDLTPEETRQVRAIAEQEVATISMVILSVLTIMLSKIARQDDIVVGMVVAGREQVELESMIGMFPLVLPLRVYPKASMSFREYLVALKSTFLSTFDNQSYQYEELARELNLERNTSRNPWFDVMYLYQNFETSELVIPGLKISSYKEQNIAAYEKLNLSVSENAEQIFLKLVYSKALFKKSTIGRWTGYFRKVIKAFIANMDVRISEIEIIPDAEKAVLLNPDNHAKETPGSKVFTALFAEQAVKTPAAIAIEHEGSSLTYEALYDRSARLASCLIAAGIRPGMNVAVYLPRGIDMLTAMLAILHSGGTYVPIDIEFPPQRIREILMDSRSEVVISSRQVIPEIEDWELSIASVRQMIYLDEADNSKPEPFDVAGKDIDSIAYIIYTSGTTGKPKGVMIHQLGMINHLYGLIDILKLSGNDTVAQTAAPCFDISIWQFLAALLTGGRIRVVDKEKIQDPQLLLEELQQGAITIFQSVPSLITRFLDDMPAGQDSSLPHLRWMIPTGEPLPVILAGKWYSHYPEIPLLNAYGPAEASDDVTTYVVEPPVDGQLSVPIGKPIRNMRVYILDDFLNLCPVGVKGEICVAGIGVGKGYWNDEEKTRATFLPNPWVNGQMEPDYATLYKTGDLGYYLADYNIVCTGRKDDQVKVRGFRIELGEIESRLLQHGALREVKLLAREWAGEKYLVAYYVAEHEINPIELENYLSDKLPGYMIPSYFVCLKQIPLTPNGKLDRRALPDPDIKAEAEYISPSGDMENKLVEIWAEVLKLTRGQISIDASFFYLGGHSLNVITLINKIHKEFNVKVALKDFFMKPTVRYTAEYIEVRQWIEKEGDLARAGKTEILI